jgi:CTP:molybdopterin cytidylyltransferase MocA
MHVGLILAAGSGSRLGTPKASLVVGGQRLVDRAINNFTAAGISEIYVVLGAWQGVVEGAHVIVNENWQDGMASSLKIGLEHISKNTAATDVTISLVDLPGMTPDAIREVVQSSHDIVVGTFAGKPGHPVKFAKKYWNEISQSATGDMGARNFLKGRDDVHFIPLDHLATGKDIDTPEDLLGQ